ncbi:MAG: glycoside hydrolase family 130 protein [Candidatus Nanopelagicales bacterium]
MTFLPGQELLTPGESRVAAVLDRVLALSPAEVDRELAATLASFGTRHRDLPDALAARFELIAHRLPRRAPVSRARRQLMGAYCTKEFAIEAAALFNPSMVAHPDQSGQPDGSVRFLMSVRAVGEGHVSSVEFRTGTIDANDTVAVDRPDGFTVLPSPRPPLYSKAVFAAQVAAHGMGRNGADFVLGLLADNFGPAELRLAIDRLYSQELTRGHAGKTIEQLERIAECNYSVEFAEGSAPDQRVLIPHAPTESHGMEDLRLVRFTDDDGTIDYRGTYTAFDGTRVVPQLMRTRDFRGFDISQLSGPAARDKGMAIFPRTVEGQYLALSRWDRESNTVAASSDLGHWEEWGVLQTPRQPWEIVQVGNCGPPIETERGWLVLTHGVGPMREYSMGAMLLDLHDPRVVVGRLPEPLITPRQGERDGYVPNVVYSCGGLLHGRTLVLPYGCADSFIRIALVDLDALLTRLAP